MPVFTLVAGDKVLDLGEQYPSNRVVDAFGARNNVDEVTLRVFNKPQGPESEVRCFGEFTLRAFKHHAFRYHD